MKDLIPQEQRGRTISSIIVLCTAIAFAAAILYFGNVWKGVTKVIGAASPILIGFGIAFLLLPMVNRMDRFFTSCFTAASPIPG